MADITDMIKQEICSYERDRDRAAVDDLNFESQCRNCKHKKYGLNTVCKECRGNKYEWRYADEALSLIGKDTNVPGKEGGE